MSDTNRIDPPAVVAHISPMVHAHRPDCDCHGCAVRRVWRHGPTYAQIDVAALDRVTPASRTATHAHRVLHAAAGDTFPNVHDDAQHYAGSVLATPAERRAAAEALALENLTSL